MTIAGNILNLLRLLLAVIWTLGWGTLRFLDHLLKRLIFWPELRLSIRSLRVLRALAFCWGRRKSPKAVICECCGWAGPMRWAAHGYDYEGFDAECPHCGRMETLRPLVKLARRAWSS